MNQNSYIIEILETIGGTILLKNGFEYPAYIDSEKLSLVTKDFSLKFDEESYKFIISFILGITGYETAEYMKIILSYIEIEELQIYEDCYYDTDNEILLYGKDAVDKRYEKTLQKFNSKKCIICDGIYPEEYINNNSICAECESKYNDMTWC